MAVTQADLESARAEFNQLVDASARERDAWAVRCAAGIKPWVEMQLTYHAQYESATTDALSDEEIVALKKEAFALADAAAAAFPGAFAAKGRTHGSVGSLQSARSILENAADPLLADVPKGLGNLLRTAGFPGAPYRKVWEFFDGYGDNRSDRAGVPTPDIDDYARAYFLASEAGRKVEAIETQLAQQKSVSRFNSL